MEHFSMQQYIVRNRRFCGYKYALLIYGNPDLKSLYINGLRVKAERVFIKANRNIDLNEFFGMYSIMGGNIKDEIDIGTEEECTMEMARYDSRCTTLVGDVEYRPEKALNKNVWSRTSKVLGTILIDHIAETSLQLPRNLFIDAWASPAVKIVNNRDLKQIDALLYIKIDGPKPWFWFENNTGFCNTIDLRKKIETKVETTINWDDECLQTCQGGKVSEKYLKRLGKFCHVLNGSLIVEGLEEIPDGLEKLNQIETISGQLKVRNNQAIKDMSFLSNLKAVGDGIHNKDGTKYGMEINDVSDFTLKGLQSLRKIRGNVLVITKDDEDVPPLVRERITTGTIDGTVKFVSLSALHATTQETEKTEKVEKDTTESTSTTESPTNSIEAVPITETEEAEEVREYTLGIPVLEENRDYLMSEYTKAHHTHVEIVPIIVAVGLVLAIIAIAFIVVLGLLSRRKKKIRRSKRNTNRNHPQSKTGQTTTATMTKEDVTEQGRTKSLSKKLEVVSQNNIKKQID
nr:EGF receptor domain containing protein [Haemonchus contortus]